MPYARWEDVNPALKSIKPKISLNQANMISRWADKMEASDNPPDSPWAVAIANFKKIYTPKDGRWVKKEMGEKEENDSMEEVTKTIGGEARPAGDFLVVIDAEKPSTWHLPVKKNGKPDHKLMGAAWAALHVGFRGKTYEGPEKSKAISKLKAMYKSEEIELPEAEPPEVPKPQAMREQLSDGSLDEFGQRIRWAFQDVFGMGDVNALSSLWVLEVFRNHPRMGNCLIVEEPGYVFYQVGYEETGRDFYFAEQGDWQEVVRVWEPVPSSETEETATVEVAESELEEVKVGHALRLIEAEGEQTDIVPLAMEVCLIEPGWGNKRDKNFYPAEVLKRDAEVFVDAKMYEKDHTPDKTNRDWVSIVDSIVGETELGGPVARVIVHDEGFAKRAIALSKADKLQHLECSIMARGKAKKDQQIGEQRGNWVEAITEALAVDWVTKAGARGHAVSLDK